MVDNSNLELKLDIRRHMIERYHLTPFSVFDACQGEGIIWENLKREYTTRIADYWGVDTKPQKGRVKIDSRRIIQFIHSDIIDIDTYGLPWAHWEQVLANLDRPTTVFLTAGHNGGIGNSDHHMLAWAGMESLGHMRNILLKGDAQKYAARCSLLLAPAIYNVDVLEGVEAHTKNASYYGMRVKPTLL